MTQLWPTGQPITVVTDARGVPLSFIWHEHRHTIHSIVQRWQIDAEWWRSEGRIWRGYWALITGDNLFCVIYFDRLQEEWQLTRLYD